MGNTVFNDVALDYFRSEQVGLVSIDHVKYIYLGGES